MNESKLLKDMVKYYEERDFHKEHLKGYMFDSLVYRYQLALYKAILFDHKDKPVYSEEIKHTFNRDLKRFIEILNEAIGDHD